MWIKIGKGVDGLYNNKIGAAIVASPDRDADHACPTARRPLLEF
jgi:hypothetical protein